MFKNILLLALLAFASARPEPNMFEEVITDELRKVLAPLDPLSIPKYEGLNVTILDTSLLFNFEEASIMDFSNIECTKFTPPILTKEVTISLSHPQVSAHANSYTADGVLNGQPFSSAGAADIAANTHEITVKLHADSYSLEPISLCVGEGSLEVDLSVESIEANFENADELNKELNERGPELIEYLQDYIMEHADEIVALVNTYLCHA